MAIEFKSAEISDEKVLTDLWIESFDPTRRVELLQNFTKREIFHHCLREINQFWKFLHLWLILNDEKVIGYLFTSSSDAPYKKCNGKATIHEIYLMSQFRNHGIERQALYFFEEFCDERNLHLSFAIKPEWKLF